MNKPLSYGFPPLVADNSVCLILGSIPGQKSLEMQQYYAHPRNSFWPIMAELTGLKVADDYSQRCQHLIDTKVAVWDVLQSCHRPGSLDQAIDENTIEANDFIAFLDLYPHIHSIFFNGAKAEQLFNRRVYKPNKTKFEHINFLKLPSTSPAHAAISQALKAKIWLEAIRDVLS